MSDISGISINKKMKSNYNLFKNFLFVKVIEINNQFLVALLVPSLVHFVNFLSVQRRQKKKYVSNETARLVSWAKKSPSLLRVTAITDGVRVRNTATDQTRPTG